MTYKEFNFKLSLVTRLLHVLKTSFSQCSDKVVKNLVNRVVASLIFCMGRVNSGIQARSQKVMRIKKKEKPCLHYNYFDGRKEFV